jgi:hypothetical protein
MIVNNFSFSDSNLSYSAMISSPIHGMTFSTAPVFHTAFAKAQYYYGVPLPKLILSPGFKIEENPFATKLIQSGSRSK